MKRVYLLRHAKSEWASGAMRDHDRPLAPRGRRAAVAMGRHMQEQGYIPERVYCSSALRTRETWQRVAGAGGFDVSGLIVVGRLYEAPARTILSVVEEADLLASSILIVGHEPAVSGALSRLIGFPPVSYPTGTLAVIDFPGAEGWTECKPGSGVLTRLLEPAELGEES